MATIPGYSIEVRSRRIKTNPNRYDYRVSVSRYGDPITVLCSESLNRKEFFEACKTVEKIAREENEENKKLKKKLLRGKK